jgi:hypothetical protein
MRNSRQISTHADQPNRPPAHKGEEEIECNLLAAIAAIAAEPSRPTSAASRAGLLTFT